MCVLDADGKPVEEYRLKREVLAGDVAVTSYSKYTIFIILPPLQVSVTLRLVLAPNQLSNVLKSVYFM